MASKLTEQNIMILGDLTNKLDRLKKNSGDYTLEDFEYEFNIVYLKNTDVKKYINQFFQ